MRRSSWPPRWTRWWDPRVSTMPAVRHGVEQGYVYLGDRKVPVIRLPACGPPPVTKFR